MLYIVEDAHSSRGCGTYLFAVEAENEKEAEKLAKKYIKNDERVLFPKLTRIIAHESFCPVVVNKDNVDELVNENPYTRKGVKKL